NEEKLHLKVKKGRKVLMKNSRFLLMFMVIFIVAIFTACSNGESDESSGSGNSDGDSNGNSDEMQEIEFMTISLSPTFDDYINGVIDDFEDENPNVKVTWVDEPIDQVEQVVLTQ